MRMTNSYGEFVDLYWGPHGGAQLMILEHDNPDGETDEDRETHASEYLLSQEELRALAAAANSMADYLEAKERAALGVTFVESDR